MTSVDSNFLCDSVWTSTWGWTPSPVHMRPPEPDPLPLRVDVINGWPLTINIKHINGFAHYETFKYYNSFIHSRIYKAPLQGIYSEAPPAQPRRYRSVLSDLQNALSLFLGRIRISKGSPFQVEGTGHIDWTYC